MTYLVISLIIISISEKSTMLSRKSRQGNFSVESHRLVNEWRDVIAGGASASFSCDNIELNPPSDLNNKYLGKCRV